MTWRNQQLSRAALVAIVWAAVLSADKAAEYRIEGERLTLTFPSKNQYTLERLSE